MEEQEIIKKANELLTRVMSGYGLAKVDKIHVVLQGLLDLYNKEKEKNKEFKNQLNTIKDIYYNTNDLEELSDVLGSLLSNLKEE